MGLQQHWYSLSTLTQMSGSAFTPPPNREADLTYKHSMCQLQQQTSTYSMGLLYGILTIQTLILIILSPYTEHFGITVVQFLARSPFSMKVLGSLCLRGLSGTGFSPPMTIHKQYRKVGGWMDAHHESTPTLTLTLPLPTRLWVSGYFETLIGGEMYHKVRLAGNKWLF